MQKSIVARRVKLFDTMAQMQRAELAKARDERGGATQDTDCTRVRLRARASSLIHARRREHTSSVLPVIVAPDNNATHRLVTRQEVRFEGSDGRYR